MQRLSSYSVLATGALILFGASGCSESEDLARDEIQAMYMTSVAYPAADPGALADLSNYQPQQGDPLTAVNATNAPSAAAPDPAAAGTESAAREFLTQLAGEFASGNVQAVRDRIDAAQSSALTDEKLSTIKATFDTYSILRGAIATKFGSATAEQADQFIAATANTPQLTVVDINTVSVTPNPLVPLFGPGQANDAVTLKRSDDNTWKIELVDGLDEARIDAAVAYHQQLTTALNELTTAVEGDQVTQQEALDQMQAAVAGGA